jgi:hypothetical protein
MLRDIYLALVEVCCHPPPRAVFESGLGLPKVLSSSTSDDRAGDTGQGPTCTLASVHPTRAAPTHSEVLGRIGTSSFCAKTATSGDAPEEDPISCGMVLAPLVACA